MKLTVGKSAFLLFVVLCSVFAEEKTPFKEDDLDKDRELDLLSEVFRTPPGTYVDLTDMHQSSSFSMMNQKIDQVVDMHMEGETHVEDKEDGHGAHLGITVTVVAMHMEQMGMVVDFDSRQVDDETPPEITTMFNQLIGVEQEAEMDEEGNIIMPQLGEQTSSFNPTTSLQQTSRLLKLLPDYPVQPGDSWDESVDLGETLGHFVGKVTLRGFMDYEGHDCAVLTTEGTLEIDLKEMMDKLGLSKQLGAAGDVLKEVSVSDVTTANTIYFDTEAGFVRWSTTSQSFTLNIPNPLDGSTMSIPVSQDVITKVALKDEEEAKDFEEAAEDEEDVDEDTEEGPEEEEDEDEDEDGGDLDNTEENPGETEEDPEGDEEDDEEDEDLEDNE